MAGAAGAPAQQARKPGDLQERHQARMAQRANAFKAQLKLTPEQEPAWTAFMAAMQPAQRTARLDPADMEKRTTPERIEKMQAFKAQRDAEMTRRADATKAFYAVLSPEQKKTFDTETAAMMRGAMGGRGGRGPGPGMGGMGPGMGYGPGAPRN